MGIWGEFVVFENLFSPTIQRSSGDIKLFGGGVDDVYERILACQTCCRNPLSVLPVCEHAQRQTRRLC